MKKQLLLVPMVAGLLFVACQKETPIQNPSSASQVSETFDLRSTESVSIHEQVGIDHNTKMDLYYDALEARVNQIGLNAFQPSHAQIVSRDVITDPIKDNYQHLAVKLKNVSWDLINMDNAEEQHNYMIAQINSSETSSEFKTIVLDIIEQSGTLEKLEQIQAYIKISRANISINLTGVEADIALSTLYVWEYSFNYWTANLTKWQNLLDPNGEGDPISKASIIRGDVEGATIGSIFGAYGTAPIGALPGWAVGGIGGGLIGSALTCISNILDYFGCC